jgi:Protein of unknown function (DUF3300)
VCTDAIAWIGAAVARLKRLAAAASVLSLALLAACASDVPPATSVAPTSTGAAAVSFSGTDTNLTPAQLETLVSPVALYPDDLLALVLPASTQPLQVVEAQRFLEQRKTNPSLQPQKTSDPSVVALLNYPEALARMTADLTWLQQFGTSVVNQQAGVMDAVQAFRKKTLDAGNLKSDDKQKVAVQADSSGAPQVIVIEPANPQVIYVPTYEPTTIVYAAAPGYPHPYYWSAPYPYYYSPAAPFFLGTYFGIAIGFGCAWDDHDIYHGDINVENVNINREEVRERLDNRQNSNLANQIRRNPENVWRPDRSGLSQAQASASSRSALQQSGAGGRGTGVGAGDSAGAAALSARAPGDATSRLGRQDLADPTPRGNVGVDRSYRASSSGAFAGIDRGAAVSRYSARGAGSMGGGFRGGGGRGRR